MQNKLTKVSNCVFHSGEFAGRIRIEEPSDLTDLETEALTFFVKELSSVARLAPLEFRGMPPKSDEELEANARRRVLSRLPSYVDEYLRIKAENTPSEGRDR